jgi:hypothetical protein
LARHYERQGRVKFGKQRVPRTHIRLPNERSEEGQERRAATRRKEKIESARTEVRCGLSVKLESGWSEDDDNAYVSRNKLMVLHQPDKTLVTRLLCIRMQPKMKSWINRCQYS